MTVVMPGRDGQVPSRPAGLWYPASPGQAEVDLLVAFAAAWPELTWAAMGTWYRKDAAQPARGFAERYPELVLDLVARTESVRPGGGVSTTEWCTVAPSPGLHAHLGVLRRSRGIGGCFSLLTPGFSVARWYGVSSGLLWRYALSLGAGGGFEETDDVIVSRYLAEVGLAVVPLDYHPVGGYVIFGAAERLRALDERLPGVPPEDVDKIVAGGGGPAL